MRLQRTEAKLAFARYIYNIVKTNGIYYSEPNRIVLFFGDAEVSSDYTRVGYFDYTEEFKNAVESNPILEGWGNKIVLINSMD